MAPEQAGTKDSHDLQWGTNVELHPAQKPTADCAPPLNACPMAAGRHSHTPASHTAGSPQSALPERNPGCRRRTDTANALQSPPAAAPIQHSFHDRTDAPKDTSLALLQPLVSSPHPAVPNISPAPAPAPRNAPRHAMPCRSHLATAAGPGTAGRDIITRTVSSLSIQAPHRRRVTHHRSAGSGALPPPQT